MTMFFEAGNGIGMKTVSQAEFARMCGVNRSTVNRWITSGRIKASADGRIDPAAAARMRDATESPLPHHQARKAQFDDERQARARRAAHEEADGADDPVDDDALDSGDEEAVAIGRRMKLAMVKEREAKAELANLEVDREVGLLAERAEFDFVLADFGNALRTRLEGLADRLAGVLAGHRGDTAAIHKSLEEAAHEVLQDMSELMRRRAREAAL